MKIGNFKIDKVYFVEYEDYASFVALSRDAEITTVLSRKLYANKREEIKIPNHINIPIHEKEV